MSRENLVSILKAAKKIIFPLLGESEFLSLMMPLIFLKKMAQVGKIEELGKYSFPIYRKKWMSVVPPEKLLEFLEKLREIQLDFLEEFDFSDLYSYLSDAQKQKRSGQVFTHHLISDYIIENLEISKKDKVLDPAVGTGSFVFSLWRKVPEYDFSNLLVLDKDKNVLETFSFLSRFYSISNEKKIRVNNSDFLKMEEKEKFDVIIGNPPYINIYKIPEEEKEFFNKNFYSAYKKYDIYMLFIEKALRLLKEGGKLGFIIPDKIINQPNGTRLREYILTNAKILEITDLRGIKTFKGKAVKNIIIFLEKVKEKVSMTHKIRIRKLGGNLEEGIWIEEEYHIFQYKWEDKKEFSLEITAERERVLNKIEKNSIKLGEICYVNWGTRAVPTKEFHLSSPKDKNSRPLIKGKNLNKYTINYEGMWLDYDPKRLYNPLFEEMFLAPKLVFQEVTGEDGIVAAFDENGYFTDHSICNCIPLNYLNLSPQHRFYKKIDFSNKEKAGSYSPLYLLGIVNSSLIYFYFALKLSSGLNVYPNHVKSLPIKKATEEDKRKVEKMVKRIILVTKKEKHQEVFNLKVKLDELIYQIYDLNSKEKKIIKEYINRKRRKHLLKASSF